MSLLIYSFLAPPELKPDFKAAAELIRALSDEAIADFFDDTGVETEIRLPTERRAHLRETVAYVRYAWTGRTRYAAFAGVVEVSGDILVIGGDSEDPHAVRAYEAARLFAACGAYKAAGFLL